MAASTTCIHCGAALNRPGAQFCPKCGRPQTPAQPAQGAPAAAMPATVVGPAPAAAMPATMIGPAPAAAPAADPTVASGSSGPPPTAAVGATLTVQDGGQTRIVPLVDRPLTLGRAADNDIVSALRFVSARHADFSEHFDFGDRRGLVTLDAGRQHQLHHGRHLVRFAVGPEPVGRTGHLQHRGQVSFNQRLENHE